MRGIPAREGLASKERKGREGKEQTEVDGVATSYVVFVDEVTSTGLGEVDDGLDVVL
jgi:hypothetical protein